MKKYLALLLALVLAFGVVLTACGGDKASTTTAPQGNAGNDATDAPDETDAPTDAPVEIREITVWGQDPYVGQENLAWDLFMNEDHKAYNYMVAELEKIGIKLVPEQIANTSYSQTTNQRLEAVMDLPDIIDFQNGWSQAQIVQYGQAGNLQELTALFEQYDEDGSIMEFLTSNYSTFSSILDENGKLWFMPYANGAGILYPNGNTGLSSTYTLLLRQDWMEALGIEYKYYMTPDEIFDILKAFRDNDANGNGIADEVYSGSIGDPSFATGFGFAANDVFYCLSDGTFGHIVDHPNFPEYVKFYQKMYEEGIISPDQFNEGWAPTPANRTGALFSYSTQAWEEASVVGYEDTCNYVPVCVDDDGGENGFILPWSDSPAGMLCGWGVSNDADPEAVVDLFDWMCTEEFVLFSRWGVPGEHWDYDENGKAYDKLAGTERENNDTTLGAKVIFNWIPNFTLNPNTPETRWDDAIAKGYFDESHIYYDDWAWSKEILERQANEPDKVVYRSGSGFYAMATAAEQEAYDAVSGAVGTYWGELCTDLLTGAKSVDDLATYRQELSDLGLDTMIKVMKDRCDRFWAAQG